MYYFCPDYVNVYSKAHVNNQFIARKKLKYTFNRAWSLTCNIIIFIHNILNTCFKGTNYNFS